MSENELDLLVVGAGPTGIAIGAEARRVGLRVLLVDRGPLTAAIQGYPTFMSFFTTRDRLEVAGLPFTIPDDKPTRHQALVYYRSVVEHFGVPLALHETVLDIDRREDGFEVETEHRGVRRRRRARAVALATGYFGNPHRLGVPGEDLPWVHVRYHDPQRHFGEHVVVVGAGNSAAEAALELWRNRVRVTLVHRGAEVKGTIKYWLKPDIENRIAEGSIAARFHTVVRAFHDGPRRTLELERGGEVEHLEADAAYLLLGYEPEIELQRRCGVDLDPETLVPRFDPETCESNVPGVYVAGTLQAGRATNRIFIDNSREHAPRIVAHLAARLRQEARQPV